MTRSAKQTKDAITIVDIRDDLLDVHNRLKCGGITRSEATAIMENAKGIFTSAKVQLAYAAMLGERHEIRFLKPEAVLGDRKD